MGLGGDLIYSAAIREIKQKYPEKHIHLYDPNEMPLVPRLLSRLVKQKLFTINPSPVFLRNPHLKQGVILPRKSLVVDATLADNSYVSDVTEENVTWKHGVHAVEIICNNYGVSPRSLSPDIHISEKERENLSRKSVIPPAPFIALEPNGKTDFFGENRLWWPDRWQKLADRLSERISVVQLGDGSGPDLDGIVSLNGVLTFRETAVVLEHAAGFVGTIGGLMHLSRAVNTLSLILYSGTETVQMCGYQENVNYRISVPCSPCGLRYPCQRGRECMDFSVSDVYQKVIHSMV